MKRWERALVISMGILAGAAGGYAVFTSSNQAGTAVLLVLSAIFCLIGIQGTPLIKFASGSNSFELERKREDIDHAIAQAQAEENVDKAVGIAEGAVIAAPELMRPEHLSLIYEQRLKTALLEIGYAVLDVETDSVYDLVVEDGKEHVVFVVVKYSESQRFIPRTVVKAIIEQAAGGVVPVLLVANSFPVRPALMDLKKTDHVDFVLWHDQRDNMKLEEKLRPLLEISRA